MLYYLSQFSDQFSGLNIFRYVTFRAVAAGITSFMLCLIFGGSVIRKLVSLKVGQPIRTAEEVHKLSELHGGKAGTPTMGGVLIIGAVVVSTLLWAIPENPFVWLVLGSMLFLGALGFADDYAKVTKKKSAGISGKTKLAGQFILAAVVTYVLVYQIDDKTSEMARALYVPFYKDPVVADMGYATFLFYSMIIVGASNAVNLTDGLDGLAAGCSAMAAASYGVLAYVAGNVVIARFLQVPAYSYSSEVTVFCVALVGAALGFLWFNCYPAKVFMGDTGSLSIGGAIGVVSICCKQELLLVIVGGVFVMEAMSVILQVMSFKLTGKRIFAMSPIHHHFELKGWKENTVIVRFWILGIVFSLMALATLKIR